MAMATKCVLAPKVSINVFERKRKAMKIVTKGMCKTAHMYLHVYFCVHMEITVSYVMEVMTFIDHFTTGNT